MFSTFTVVLAYIVLIVGKGEAFEDDYGKRFLQYLTVNVHLKLFSKQMLYFARKHAIFVTLT
uniref:Uncharacterized protein n=1 Tax=Wuchereria bancrofti TaxID=6293 RepID=A0AAF5Q2I7_WUCBA